MIVRPPGSTRTDTPVPYTTLFRSTKSSSRIVDANMLDEVPKVDKVSMEKGRGLRSQELPQDFCGSDGPVAAFREAWRDICTCPIRFMRIHIQQDNSVIKSRRRCSWSIPLRYRPLLDLAKLLLGALHQIARINPTGGYEIGGAHV